MRPSCNLCFSSDLEFKGQRVYCNTCKSRERTRVLKMMLDEASLPQSGMKVLHMAPEPGLSKFLQNVVGEGYDPTDYNPARYPFTHTRKLDLVADLDSLPTDHYDLIVHSHVMEHISANITAVLWHLHRALKPDGLHICSIPILPKRRYGEEWEKMNHEEATKEYGQFDHVRRFGALDVHQSLGMIFKIPDKYDIEPRFGAGALRQNAVPETAWRGWTPHTVFEFRKDDLKLR